MKPMSFRRLLKEGMDIVEVAGKPYLFTCMRVDRKTVPDDLYVYDVRGDDETTGGFCQVKPFVMVNHWGTIIGQDPVPLDHEFGDYWCDEENDGCYLAYSVHNIAELERV